MNNPKNKNKSIKCKNKTISTQMIPIDKDGNYYSDELKIKAIQLIKQGFSYKRVGELLGVTGSTTIRDWYLQSSRYIQQDTALKVKEQLRDQYTIAAGVFLNEALEPTKLEKASTKDLVLASKIALDSMNMIDNDIFSENEYTEKILVDRKEEKKKIEDDIDVTKMRIEEIKKQIESQNSSVVDDIDIP